MPKAADIIDLTTPPRKRARYDSEASSQASRYSVAYSSSARPSSRASLRSVAESTPADSPTNPFGLSRVAKLSFALPEISSFSQQLALRFQYVQCYASAVFPNQSKDKTYVNDVNTLRRDREGVYRVVQVPLNYTFLHLHRLIFYLFGGMGEEILEKDDEYEAELGAATTSARFLRNSRKRKRSSDSFEDDNPGHLFQALKHVVMHSSGQKPGEIRRGEVFARLSNSYSDDFDDFEDNDFNISPEALTDDMGMWRDEDDFPIASIWPSGGTTERGIVYSHSNQTQIHITLNTGKIPPRKGRSNLPFVFHAKGLVRLPGYEKYLRNGTDGLQPEVVDRWLDVANFNAPGAFEEFHTYASRIDAPLSALDLPLDLDDFSSPNTPSFYSESPVPTSSRRNSFTPSSTHDYSSDAEGPPETSMTMPSSDADFPFAIYPRSSPATVLKERLITDTPHHDSEKTRKRMDKIEKRIKKDKKKLEEKVHQIKVRQAKEQEKARLLKARKEMMAKVAQKLAEAGDAVVDGEEEEDAGGEVEDIPEEEDEDQVDQLAEDDDVDAVAQDEDEADEVPEEDDNDEKENQEDQLDEAEDGYDQLSEDHDNLEELQESPDPGGYCVEEGEEDEDVPGDVAEDDDESELSAAGIFPIDEYTRQVELALEEPSPNPPSPAKPKYNHAPSIPSMNRGGMGGFLANPPHRLRLMKSRSAVVDSYTASTSTSITLSHSPSSPESSSHSRTMRRSAISASAVHNEVRGHSRGRGRGRGRGGPLFATRAEMQKITFPSLRG